MDVHLRALRCFVAVAERLSFSRAAEALFLSQPALSKQIRTLEAHLAVELFFRNRREVRLTAAGEALLPGVRQLLADWEAAQVDLEKVQRVARSHVVVGLHLGIERDLLPKVHDRLTAGPPLQLRLRQASWSDPTGGLVPRSVDAVDAAFVWLPLAQPERFRWIVVAREQPRLLVSEKHHLAGRASVPFEQLLDEPFLALPTGIGPLRARFLGAAERGGVPAPIGVEVASTEELVEAVTAGLGVCLVAAGNVGTFLRSGVEALDVTGLPPFELVLAWRHDDSRPVLQRLTNAVYDAADSQLLGEARPQLGATSTARR